MSASSRSSGAGAHRVRGAGGPVTSPSARVLPAPARLTRGRRGRAPGGVRGRVQRDARRRRPINVRPWLYRIARNRWLNHLRKTRRSASTRWTSTSPSRARRPREGPQARGVPSAGRGHPRLPGDAAPALVLREMDALAYEQIAEAMDTTVPSVKSLLVRARIGARRGRRGPEADLRARSGSSSAPSPRAFAAGPERSFAATCGRASGAPRSRCQLNRTSKALTAVLPVGGILSFCASSRSSTSAILQATGAGSGASGASAAGQAAAVGGHRGGRNVQRWMGTTTTGFLFGPAWARSRPRRSPGLPPRRS